MRYDRISIKILYKIREKGEIALDNLMYATGYGMEQFFKSSQGYFFDTILDLYNNNIIIFLNEDVCSFINHNYHLNGYSFSRFLRNKNLHDIKISLTDNYYNLQNVLGFSLTDLYIQTKHPSSILLDPIWGKPNPKISCDVFVIMPFSDELNPIFEDHITKIAREFKLIVERADLVFNVGTVVEDIWSLIYSAKIVICDCTNKNPNVFYELGIAHSVGKKTICITQKEEDIPFDINYLRYIKYEYTPRGMNKFEEELRKHINSILFDE